MGLKDVADSRIGGSIIRGISGGEQRRVTIAIQLLKDPGTILLQPQTDPKERSVIALVVPLARAFFIFFIFPRFSFGARQEPAPPPLFFFVLSRPSVVSGQTLILVS